MYLEIDEGYPGHRKTLRLCALLKCDTADAYPPRLWAWAARSAPDGDLTGMDAVELELALRWRGEEGVLFAALVRAGFVDQECANGPTTIHNWAGRTGGAIEKMAARAGMAKERRQHMDGKCIEACRYCTGTLTLRSPARSSQDKTRQDQSSDLPSPAFQASESDARSEGSANVWTVFDWRRKYGMVWSKKYGGTAIGGDGKADMRLREILESLPGADLLATQERAQEMFREFLAEGGEAIQARHRWAWFVGRFESLRVKRLALVPSRPANAPPAKPLPPSTVDMRR